MTSESLKPQMSDLEKMFDSEDEDERAATSTTSMHLVNGHGQGFQQSLAPSGGMSMASAQAVGPISKYFLCEPVIIKYKTHFPCMMSKEDPEVHQSIDHDIF